jgi:hypothetical protein
MSGAFFWQSKNHVFALRRWILLWQNPRAISDRPYEIDVQCRTSRVLLDLQQAQCQTVWPRALPAKKEPHKMCGSKKP